MSDTKLPVVAKRLREARERQGLSQKSLGIAAGIDPSAASARLNQYERGKHIPDLLTVKNLAAVLSVPVPYLYAEDEQLAELLLFLHALPRSQWETVKKYLARKAEAAGTMAWLLLLNTSVTRRSVACGLVLPKKQPANKLFRPKITFYSPSRMRLKIKLKPP